MNPWREYDEWERNRRPRDWRTGLLDVIEDLTGERAGTLPVQPGREDAREARSSEVPHGEARRADAAP